MLRNEWLKDDNFKPWDVGYLGAGSLGITMSNKSTGSHKAVQKDASRRQRYSGASLYLTR